MDFLFNTNVEFFIVAYLVGAIPFGLLLAKRFAGVDVKSAGSGSIGATNVLRVLKEHRPKIAKKLHRTSCLWIRKWTKGTVKSI